MIETDGGAPSVSCPSNVVGATTDTGVLTYSYSWAATAVDAIDQSVPVSCNVSSPHDFAVGSTVVECSGVDDSGNSDSCIFSVEVSAPGAPSITSCPSDVSVPTSSGASCATVTWGSVSANDKDGVAMSVPTPSSSPTGGLTNGSSFCFGVTAVSYNFSDSVSGLWSECGFDVTVTGMLQGRVMCTHTADMGVLTFV